MKLSDIRDGEFIEIQEVKDLRNCGTGRRWGEIDWKERMMIGRFNLDFENDRVYSRCIAGASVSQREFELDPTSAIPFGEIEAIFQERMKRDRAAVKALVEATTEEEARAKWAEIDAQYRKARYGL